MSWKASLLFFTLRRGLKGNVHSFGNLKVTPFIKKLRWIPTRTLMILTSETVHLRRLRRQESLLRLIECLGLSWNEQFPNVKGNQFNVYKFIWRSKANYPKNPLSFFKVDPWSSVSFSSRSMAVEEFIIQDKSICFSATSSAVLLIPSSLCLLIGLQSSVISAALVLLPTLSFQSNDTKANFTPTSRSV